VSCGLERELVAYLNDACALEKLSLALLKKGLASARDQRVAGIYRLHREQTDEHLLQIESRLEAYGGALCLRSGWASIGALGIVFSVGEAHTSTQLAIAAYALENVEIALYHLLEGIAEHHGDEQTAAVVAGILEEEEQTAELLAGNFDRALAVTLHDISRQAD
jgi:ferritin-like metal-binding protein YciE